MRILMLILILSAMCLAKWPAQDTLTVEYGKAYYFMPTKNTNNSAVLFLLDENQYHNENGIPMDLNMYGQYGPFYFPKAMFDGNSHILKCKSQWDESWRLKTSLYNAIEKRTNIGSGSNIPNGITYDILGRKVASRSINGISFKRHLKIIKVK